MGEQQPTVLCFDDEEAILKMYKAGLSRFLTNCSIICVRTRREALEALKNGHNISAVLSDWRAPSTNDGEAVVRRASELQIPVIVLSGTAEEADSVRNLCKEILQKPIELKSLAGSLHPFVSTQIEDAGRV